MTKVYKDTLITKFDLTGKSEFRRKIVFQKRHLIVKKLNTRSHAKFPATILKNPYYTPCIKKYGSDYYTPWRYDLLHFEFMTYAKINIS